MKYIILIFFILLILIILEQFTVLNLFHPSLFMKPEYEGYKYLKEGIESENYRIQFIENDYRAYVRYNDEQNFFMVGRGPYRKISGKGEEEAVIPPGLEIDNPPLTHYLFDKEGVYDFSKSPVTMERYSETINEDYKMDSRLWQEMFDSYYERAGVVVYGENREYQYYQAYLKINKSWVRIFSGSYDNFTDDRDLGINMKGYPARFKRMIPLMDPENREFSLPLSRDIFSKTGDKVESYSSSKRHELKKLFFRKEFVSDHIPYTPIPGEFAGTAYYRIRIHGDILNFRENALKYISSFSSKSCLYWYLLPERYHKQTGVSFLELRYPHNINESGSRGLYILKPRKGSAGN